MKKIFAFITFSFLLFGFIIFAEAKDCDWNTPTCGGWAGCSASGNYIDCSADAGFGSWAWPKCDCDSDVFWCECNEQCANEFCQNFGFYKGECQSNKSLAPNCFYNTETTCNDKKDNDNDGDIDCEDTDCDGKTCDSNKICKKNKCVDESKTAVCDPDLDCQQMISFCLCGEDEEEVESGEFCCSVLSEKYNTKSECEEECDAAKSEGGNGGGEDEEDGGWIFTCPGEETVCPEGAFCIENPLCAKTFEDLINAIVRFITRLAIAIAPIMFIWAGVLFVTAAGDPAKIQKARDVVLWTIIGLGIVLMSYAIIKVIQEIFGG